MREPCFHVRSCLPLRNSTAVPDLCRARSRSRWGLLILFPSPLACRTFCSNPASTDGSPDAIIIESEEDFNNSLKKVQEGALPAIFYFSAVWCGPCKFLAPVVNQLSKMYPPCVTYKIDIDMEGMQSKLSELGISAVPTLSFFNGGKKVATVVGADVKKIKDIMDEFFK